MCVVLVGAAGDGPMTGGSRRAERRSPSPRSPPLAAPGYEQYSKSLLDVPYLCVEYGEASSDDLSSEWDSDVPEPPQKVPSLLFWKAVVINCTFCHLPFSRWHLAENVHR